MVVDSGAFMGYPSMYLRVPDAPGFVFPQAFQCVGLGLGNAIGAAVARPDRLTVAALGDGGLLMALPELETLGRLKRRHARRRLQRRGLRRRGAPLPPDGHPGRARAVPADGLRRARRGRRLPRASPPAASTTSSACASGSPTATARSCWTPKSTPTSVPNGWRRHFVAIERRGTVRHATSTAPLADVLAASRPARPRRRPHPAAEREHAGPPAPAAVRQHARACRARDQPLRRPRPRLGVEHARPSASTSAPTSTRRSTGSPAATARTWRASPPSQARRPRPP